MNETETETKVAKCGEASEKGGEAKRIFLSTVRGGPGWSGYIGTPKEVSELMLMRSDMIRLSLLFLTFAPLPACKPWWPESIYGNTVQIAPASVSCT